MSALSPHPRRAAASVEEADGTARASHRSVQALRLEVSADAASVPRVRHAVGELAAQVGAGPECVADVRLAVTEAMANVVMHAYDEPGGCMTVEARASRDGLDLTIADSGRGLASRTPNPGLGRGLSLMTLLADEIVTESQPGQGVRVRLRFRFASCGSKIAAA